MSFGRRGAGLGRTGSGGGASYTTYLKATFNAANGTALESYTPEVGGAVRTLSTIGEVQGNKAQREAAQAANYTYLWETGASDGVFTGDMTLAFDDVSNYESAAIMFRGKDADVDSNNAWLFRINGNNTAEIISVVAGTPTQEDSGAWTSAAGTYTGVVTLAGTSITCTVGAEGISLSATSSSLQTEQEFGINGKITGTPTNKSNFDNILFRSD